MEWLYWIISIGAVFIIPVLLRSKKPSLDGVSLKGKNVIITGANTGIGKATAISLAKMGGHIILACRSKERAEAAIKDIIKESKNPNVEFMALDLCSFDSVKEFASEFLARDIPCHYLVNNAGVMYMHSSTVADSPIVTKDGYNVQFIANYLGHFLLTVLLLDNIKKSGARVISVTSSTHHLTAIDFNDIQGFNCPHFISYSRSKLAQIYFTYSLQKMFEKEGCKATANCVHPGYIASDIVRYLGPAVNYVFHFVFEKWLGWDVNDGASGIIYVTSTPTLDGVGGKYFSKCDEKKSSKISYDEEVAKKLWDVTERMVGLKPSLSGDKF